MQGDLFPATYVSDVDVCATIYATTRPVLQPKRPSHRGSSAALVPRKTRGRFASFFYVHSGSPADRGTQTTISVYSKQSWQRCWRKHSREPVGRRDSMGTAAGGPGGWREAIREAGWGCWDRPTRANRASGSCASQRHRTAANRPTLPPARPHRPKESITLQPTKTCAHSYTCALEITHR